MSKWKDVPVFDPINVLSKIRLDGECWRIGKNKTYTILQFNKAQIMAHRVTYTIFKGEIPKNLVIDHECMNKWCVNPDHLRVVTERINAIENNPGVVSKCAFVTNCPSGHEYSPENIYLWRNKRHCIACRKIRNDISNNKRRTNK